MEVNTIYFQFIRTKHKHAMRSRSFDRIIHENACSCLSTSIKSYLLFFGNIDKKNLFLFRQPKKKKPDVLFILSSNLCDLSINNEIPFINWWLLLRQKDFFIFVLFQFLCQKRRFCSCTSSHFTYCYSWINELRRCSFRFLKFILIWKMIKMS